ncbi:nucleotide exchange factor GrpE [Sphaerisporangium perillae]|uniref:nucleotide exchange factor GrpE n=1 Tax=Sphaerisporangium perillae TaxID=2935860 RepID=UPI00200BE17C|nr:nucleotide exchange factor GrpE [Sphaerisporangium perillae]
MADERGRTPPGTNRPPPPGPVPGAPGTGPEAWAASQVAEPAGEVTENEGVSPVEDMDAKIAELEDRWLRSAAELDNLRKRIARDAERIRAEERARTVRELLPIIDNLDLALRHADADPGAVVEGVRAVRDQAVAMLARLGFPRHDEVGVPFNPAHHEAVGTVANPEVPPGTVADVVRPGYGDRERQLRPAAVIVSMTPE